MLAATLLIALLALFIWLIIVKLPQLSLKERPKILMPTVGRIGIGQWGGRVFFLSGLALIVNSIFLVVVEDYRFVVLGLAGLVALMGWYMAVLWLPVYDIAWNKTCIEGPGASWPFPFGPKRVKILWSEIVVADVDQPQHGCKIKAAQKRASDGITTSLAVNISLII